MLAWAVIVTALGLVGWVAKTTLAQGPGQRIPANAPAAEPVTAPSLPADLNVPTVKAAVQATPDLSPDFESKPAALASPIEPNQVSPRSSLEEISATNGGSAGSKSAASATTDPEKAALVFVAENQKLAESQLKNLKDEEAKLQARLLKVQAGIQRWESLVEALKQSQGSVAAATPKPPTSRIEAPSDLEPVSGGSSSSVLPK